jgi:hypothetical protein
MKTEYFDAHVKTHYRHFAKVHCEILLRNLPADASERTKESILATLSDLEKGISR